MISLLQRRIFSEIFKVSSLCLGVLLLFILLARAIHMRDLFFGLELEIWDALRLFGYLCPVFLQMVFPVAVMLGIFLTFLRLNSDRELVALKAGGISLYQLLAAPLLFSLVGAFLTLWISMYWVPWGMGQFRENVLEIAGNKAKIVLQGGVFNKDIPNMVFYARNVDPVQGNLAHVIVGDKSYPETSITILAPEGHIGTDYERGEVVFLLKSGQIYNERGGVLSVLGFDEYALRLSISKLFQGVDLGPIKPSEMSNTDLQQLTLEAALQGNVNLKAEVETERHRRVVFPFACLVLGILAIPLATAFQGVQRQLGLVLALVQFLIYYGILSLGIGLSEANLVPPLWGLWVPNIVFLFLGVVGVHLAAQERFPRVFARISRWQEAREQVKLASQAVTEESPV